MNVWVLCLLCLLFAWTPEAQREPRPVEVLPITKPTASLYFRSTDLGTFLVCCPDKVKEMHSTKRNIPLPTRPTTTRTPCINDHFLTFPLSFRPGQKLPVLIYVNGGSFGDVYVTVSLISSQWDMIARSSIQSLVTSDSISLPRGTSRLIELDVPADMESNQNFLLNATGSGALTFHDSTSLYMTRMLNATFIQTDKATYRPGEEVKFWIFTIFPNMTTVHTAFDVVIEDPRNNIVYESTINSSAEGLAEGRLRLPDKPPTGTWRILVNVVGSQLKETKQFTVEQYVLPRFQVTVTLPEYIIKTDPGVSGKISVRYVYDEPLSGNVLITATLKPRWCTSSGYQPACEINKFSQQYLSLDDDGEAAFDIDMDVLKGLSYYNSTTLSNEMLVVVANATESATGIVMSGKASSIFHQYLGQVSYPFGVPAFKPGLLYRIMVMVVDPSGDPLDTYDSQLNVTIYKRNCTYIPTVPVVHNSSTELIFIRLWPGKTVCEQETLLANMHNIPDTGMVLVEFPNTFSFDTSSSYWSNVYIESSYGDISNSRSGTLQKAVSEDNSFMRITLSQQNPRVGDLMTVTVVSTPAIIGVFYTIVSKGNLEVVQRYDIPGGRSMTTFSFSFRITQDMSPRARLVVFHSETAEIVADGINFAVQGLFRNKVSLSFQKDDFLPDDEALLTVTGDAGSLAAVLTVDKSVLVHRSGNRILTKDVMRAMRNFDFGYPGGYFIDVMWYGGMWPIWRPDRTARDIFRQGGIGAMPACLLGDYANMYRMFDSAVPGASFGESVASVAGAPAAAISDGGGSDQSELAEVKLERKLFPETFIWKFVPIGPSGRTTIATHAPHTITTWVASAFALNDNTGLGIAPETEMRVFLSFFVSMNLPQTAIRGETLLVQVLVFNYYTISQEVTITFASSATHTLTVQGNGVGSAYFPIRPLSVGPMTLNAQAQSTLAADAVERTIEILYEGIETCNTVSYFILLDEEPYTFSEEVNITFPNTLVTDSVRVMAYLTGDTMIGVLRNPERLIRLPSGCGEQTIKTFAPLVHVMSYLALMNTLTPKMRTEIIDFLTGGYINELKFQHPDGSFSTWGPANNRIPNSRTGMMSLTAFVVKSFKAARPHIFIDPSVISSAVRWIFEHQNKNGSFNDVGRSFAHRLKGDALTAYVLIAIMDGGPPSMTPSMEDGIERAANYIEVASRSATKPLNLAMYAYALTLAGRVSAANAAVTRLETLRQPSGAMTYWFNHPARGSMWRCWHCGRADDIETAAYAILIYKWRGDIADAFMVLKWLVKQQRSYGGFVSTQDTALAIQAMSAISMDIPPDVSMTVLLESPFFRIPVTINDANRMEIQSFPVMVPLNVSATGSGAALVKIETCYNALEPELPEGFDLRTTIDDESLMSFTLEVCFRYLNGDSTGMVVVNIGLPTGFEMESVAGTYDNLEVEKGIVVVYLSEVTATEECLLMVANRAGRQSSGTKDVAVEIINYYDPDEKAANTYALTADRGNYCMVCQGACTVC